MEIVPAMQVQAIGIPWYRKEDYPKLLGIFEDADKLPGAFEDWLSKAESVEKAQCQVGRNVFRVIIEPDAFPLWCASKGLKIDSHSRNVFVTHKVSEIVMGKLN